VFRAYDIRGIYGEELTPELMSVVGSAAAECEGGDFVVGCDTRSSSPLLKLALASGIMASGVSVTDVGTVPIGAMFFSTVELKLGAMAYVTASHLPPEWNGVKLCHSDGLYFAPGEIRRVGEIAAEGSFSRPSWRGVGCLKLRDVLREYEEFLVNTVSGAELRVVLDLGNGATSLVAPRAFRRLGFDVSTLFENVDPAFSGRGAEPRPECLSELSRAVVSRGADVGVAYDGDGDRAVFTDERGRPLMPEQVAVLLAEGGLGGTIVASADCSSLLERYAEEAGVKVVRVPVGHTYMVRKVIETGAAIGVEHSGHVTIGRFSKFDDGILASLVVCSVAASLGRPVSRLVPEPPHSKRVKVMVDERLKFRVVSELIKEYEREFGEVDTTDGVRVSAEGYWVLVRASNTEPVVRIAVEAESESLLDDLVKKFTDDVKRVYRKLRREGAEP